MSKPQAFGVARSVRTPRPAEDRRDCPPPRSRPAPGDRLLRDVFGSFTTGVTVISCFRPDGRPFGVTVSSFTAVSLDPPLVLVCLKRSGWSGRTIAMAGCFAVNILQQGQQDEAAAFSGRADLPEHTKWSSTGAGIPVLEQSLGIVECAVHKIHKGGDHDIILGRVLNLSSVQQLEPLVYYRGKFRSLAEGK